MKKVKVSELKGGALSWAAGMAAGLELSLYGVDPSIRARVPGQGVYAPWAPHRFWNQAGPIIERMELNLTYDKSAPELWRADNGIDQSELGPTPLVAAMRCYVASKFGDEVEIPDEL